jgi:hypothetical protein
MDISGPRLMDSNEIVKSAFRNRQAKFGRLLHEADFGGEILGLLGSAHLVPSFLSVSSSAAP